MVELELERNLEVLPLRISNLPEARKEPKTQGGLIQPVLKTFLYFGVGESRESFSPPLSQILPSSLQERTLWAEAQKSQLSEALIQILPPPHQVKLSLLRGPISHLLCARTLRLPDIPETHLLSWVPLASGFATSKQTKALSPGLPYLPGLSRGSNSAVRGACRKWPHAGSPVLLLVLQHREPHR